MALTETYASLKVKQVQAIALIVSGKTSTEIAETLGVRLATVSNWRNHNSAFRQALAIQLKQRIIEYRIGFPSEKSKIAPPLQKRS